MRTIIENWKKLALLLLILLILFLLGTWSQNKAETSWNVNQAAAVNSPLSDEEENDKVEEAADPEVLEDQPNPEAAVVDVKGAVRNPGVYTVPSDSRLHEVIEKAGGFTAEADPIQVNLALKVWDEMLLYVPAKGESAEITEVISPPAGPENAAAKKININTASQSELMELTGIGEKKAAAIIEYREQNGTFEAIEDLLLVPGIGEGILSNIREDISL